MLKKWKRDLNPSKLIPELHVQTINMNLRWTSHRIQVFSLKLAFSEAHLIFLLVSIIRILISSLLWRVSPTSPPLLSSSEVLLWAVSPLPFTRRSSPLSSYLIILIHMFLCSDVHENWPKNDSLKSCSSVHPFTFRKLRNLPDSILQKWIRFYTRSLFYILRLSFSLISYLHLPRPLRHHQKSLVSPPPPFVLCGRLLRMRLLQVLQAFSRDKFSSSRWHFRRYKLSCSYKSSSR